MLEQQQQAYKVEGVDESEPAVDMRKRKARDGEEVSGRRGKLGKARLTGRRVEATPTRRSKRPKHPAKSARTRLCISLRSPTTSPKTSSSIPSPGTV